jgi:predicted O-methyltransferase YrrM
MPAAEPQLSSDRDAMHARLARARQVREHIYKAGEMPDATGAMRPVWPVGLTKGRGQALFELARSCRATKILETGLGLAMSSSFLLDAAISTYLDSGQRDESAGLATPSLTSIDPGEREFNADAGLLHLRDAGLAPLHRFIDDRSELALPELVRSGEQFDLIFIDGNHLFDGAMIDTYFALRLIKPGGLIVLDDVWMPAVRKASAFFVNNQVCTRESVFSEGGKERLHALRPNHEHVREWDHFAEF